MKVLMVYNSYAEQLERLSNLLRLYDPLPSKNCNVSASICFDITIALKFGEFSLSNYSSIQVNHISPHRRWFLSAFYAFEKFYRKYDWYFILDGDSIAFLKQLEPIILKYPDPGSRSWYIGANTESYTSIIQNGVFPYGGGGVLISSYAMKLVYSTKEACLQKYRSVYGGDELMYRCFVDVGVHDTLEPSFHQMDVMGDVTGLFETHLPHTGLTTLHHIKHLYLGYNPMEASLSLLTDASNQLGALFVRREQINSTCKSEASDHRGRAFLLTHGVSLVEFNPLLARRDAHLFDATVVVKTHVFWGRRDHERRLLHGKRLVPPSNALLERRYLHSIRTNATHIVQTFDGCDTVTGIMSRRTLVMCQQDCIYEPTPVHCPAPTPCPAQGTHTAPLTTGLAIAACIGSLLLLLLRTLSRGRR